MANIYVESKGPKGTQLKESLQLSAVPVPAVSRGLAVAFSTDQFHVAAVAAAGASAIGILEEDAIVIVEGGVSTVGEPSSVIELGQAVAQIGANIAVNQPLATDVNGRLVPAKPGQPVVAVALEPQVYVAPASFACVLVIASLGIVMPGSDTTYYAAAGAILVAQGTAVIDGAAALAMTLAQPTAAEDGLEIFITAETTYAHTITTAANGINGAKHTVTFAAQGDGVVLQAVNGVWNVRGLVGGAVLA